MDETTTLTQSQRVVVCDVQFRLGSKTYFFDPGPLSVPTGAHVIIDTARGAEYGFCVAGNHSVPLREVVQPLRRVLRVATEIDERIRQENVQREKKAFAFCREKVEQLGLDMQLVSAECSFDGSKLLFFFTADARVDFRELVKILASNLHARIELRQIGVRDKAKMLGGLGICGRPFCCAQFLDDFQPVSIKMAKTQNLSLNPTKISGTCGRLMCCLKYEQEAYEDLIRTSPRTDSLVDTPDGRGTVTTVNLMRQSVNVRLDREPDELRCYKNCDICVLRSGKGRKTDPPIPDDLAPISGQRPAEALSRAEQRLTLDLEAQEAGEAPAPEEKTRRERKPKPPREEGPALPPEETEKKFSRRRERKPQGQAAPKPDKQPAPKPEKQPEKKPETQRRNERKPERKPDKQQAPKPEKQAAPKPEKQAAPKPEKKAEAPAPQKKNNRRRYFPHNNKKSGG